MPLLVGYLVCSLIILPLVIYGMTRCQKMQVWTQPVWLVLMVAAVRVCRDQGPGALSRFTHFGGNGERPRASPADRVGAGAGVALSLIAQIGEQVDYLRFMPDKTAANARGWWTAVLAAGPGWVILGAAQAARRRLPRLLRRRRRRPGQGQTSPSSSTWPASTRVRRDRSRWAVAALFVILSQIKINITNAYSGSLSWSNFFSRLTHRHPGRGSSASSSTSRSRWC